MEEVVIKNKELLSILNEVLWFYENNDKLGEKHQCWNHDKNEKDYLSDDYLNKIVKMGSAHDGYPEVLKGINLVNYHEKIFNDKNEYISKELVDKFKEINERLMLELSVRNNAVATIYPPDGFISWHNNANATGFNIIFTWSETGDGWFDYVDPETKQRVRCKDRKGEWVCKYGMFGSYYDDKNPVIYHAADTNCWRITLAYIFDKNESTKDFQDFIIEEISNP